MRMTYQTVLEPERPSMARKPKAQPSPEAAVDDAPAPARQGRKPKAAAPSPELPLALGDDGVTDEVEAGAAPSAPTDTPRRREPGRKPKSSDMAAVAPFLQDDAEPQQDPKPGTAEPELAPDSIEANAPEIEARPEVATADSAGATQPDSGPDTPADDAQQPLPGLEAHVPAKPAAQWDRTTDTVQFDWPAIERTAAEAGPNQGMAKLLIAARAEGANSRWPL
jgi:hypothetical protein